MNNNNWLNCFYAREFSDGTWGVELRIVIYRALHKKHPDFLEGLEGNAREGYNTKFFLLIEDGLTETEAVKKSNENNREYAQLVKQCEDTGDWDKFPFKDSPVVYYK